MSALGGLPYGVVSSAARLRRRVAVAVGEQVLDAGALAAADGLEQAPALAEPSLDALLSLGRASWTQVRAWLAERLAAPDEQVRAHLEPRVQARLHLPFTVADYVDFYGSLAHAENVGRILRPDGEPLSPAWRHLPIGYHGRAGTVVVSGTPVRRPCGQRRGRDGPFFGPTRRLDVEAEVGFVVGTGSQGPVPPARFGEHVFGVVLLNDWSARDVQALESAPLGPFLGKAFATSISGWVLPLEALDAARVDGPVQDPTPLPHLRTDTPSGYDVALEVVWNGTVVSRPPYASTYWTAAQQLAHLTSGGATLRTGDLFASGTVSGPEPGQRGSFLELSWGGLYELELDDGSRRTFLEDGDTVVLRGSAPAVGGGTVELGEVRSTVLPATGA